MSCGDHAPKRAATLCVGSISRLNSRKKSQQMQGTRARANSAYWPIKGAPELRPLIKELHDAGTEIVLPVVKTHTRHWSCGAKHLKRV